MGQNSSYLLVPAAGSRAGTVQIGVVEILSVGGRSKGKQWLGTGKLTCSKPFYASFTLSKSSSQRGFMTEVQAEVSRSLNWICLRSIWEDLKGPSNLLKPSSALLREGGYENAPPPHARDAQGEIEASHLTNPYARLAWLSPPPGNGSCSASSFQRKKN